MIRFKQSYVTVLYFVRGSRYFKKIADSNIQLKLSY